MMGKGIGERFEADESHEFIDFVAFLLEQSASDEAGLNVLSNGEPGEKIWVLEDESALGAWADDGFVADSKLAGIGAVQPSDEAKEGGFSAAAGADNGDQFAGSERERDILERDGANFGMVWGGKIFGDADDPEGSAFVGGRGLMRRRVRTKNVAADRNVRAPTTGVMWLVYHLMTPFCQPRTRSRTLKRMVMMVEKNAAMMTRAA